ncbi:MAG TPA: nodulation protein NfeD [bacterium]|nr:nodulation protein NfeD [bacterium]
MKINKFDLKRSWTKRIAARTALLAALLLASLAFSTEKVPKAAAGPVVLLEVKGVIGHATKNYVTRGVKHGENTNAAAVLITIDTPGGMMDSMKDIATAMINSKVPVVAYVYPSGATATSAGFFLLMAADVAAMAPNTSAGSAHPVAMGGQQMDKTMKEKAANYAVKLMEQYAERRGRNIDVARDAVLRSISVTSQEALDKGVIEIIAEDVDDLLSKIDGWTISKSGQKTVEFTPGEVEPELLDELRARGMEDIDGGETIVFDLNETDEDIRELFKTHGLLDDDSGRFTLRTDGAPVEKLPMSFRELFFQMIGHPQIAYILFMIGVYALIFEVTHPGAIFPGVVGAICLVIAFTAFQVIPINTVGLALIIGAFVLFVLEIFIVSHGLLALGGVALMVVGSLMLVDSTDPALQINIWLILSTAGTTALLFGVALAAVIATHRKKVSTGRRGMIGIKGKTLTDVNTEGKFSVRGEIWNARSKSGDPILAGESAIVVEVDGMELVIEKIKA